MPKLSEQEARAILGDDLLGVAEVESAFGTVGRATVIPFARDELLAARDAGEMLVLRVHSAGAGVALTIVEMIRRVPAAFDAKSLRQVGYLLKDEWGIEIEPLASVETCTLGWALARKEILDDSRNLPYDEQEPALQAHAAALGVATAVLRRRTAVEAVYDTVLCFHARQRRLLEKTWDWSASRTQDGGYLNVGGFSARGMQIFAYSKAIRHGGLGVCPTRQRNP